MMKFLVTADGGLTTMGYVAFVVAVLVLIAIIAVLFFKNGNAKKLTTQQLVTCAVALALHMLLRTLNCSNCPSAVL